MWYRSDYEDVDSYSYQFSEADIAEIAKAVSNVRNKGLELKVGLLSCFLGMLRACQLRAAQTATAACIIGCISLAS